MAINTDRAAKPVGAYVHAKEAGDLVFLSGVGPRHPETDEIPKRHRISNTCSF